ncbi:Polycomb Asx [Gossypium arboreum]|uniref:Polycomb Asx n=1 Tax=Gossypium arboreum TaxID=29729 RepID=A0A0B0PZ47_GOSAR|nr:Polycomb Asx [Gossypium arboreum]
MAYFCPHEQRHERVSQPCATHEYVARSCLPWAQVRLDHGQGTQACLVAL